MKPSVSRRGFLQTTTYAILAGALSPVSALHNQTSCVSSCTEATTRRQPSKHM
ncbi:twin-arginine translocation signal domain-containing protein [Mesorhizobium sp.]|uniref:twin-arginine translocation signal domain-containing protein n=1 Tax=Mesorhizobium sp. TaxID=1871066 RepID=UPI0034577E86